MSSKDKIQLFEDKRIRTAWDEEKESLHHPFSNRQSQSLIAYVFKVFEEYY